jgi:RNA methyltransferase, TrmH family
MTGRMPSRRPGRIPDPRPNPETGPSSEVTSTANPRIKAVIRLRDRHERETTGLTIVDGAREIRRALETGAEVVEAYVRYGLTSSADARGALDLLARRGLEPTPVGEAVMERIAFGDRSDGLVVVVRIPRLHLGDIALPPAPFVAVVEGIEKPGNLGAILRSADGAGVDALIAADPRTDIFNPNAIRASLGTIFARPVVTASSAETLSWLRDWGLRIVAASVDASVAYTSVDLTGPIAIVLGSEAAGLSAAWTGPDIDAVSLPMHGVADSLNVAAAAAVLFYEALRQRQPAQRSQLQV